MSTPRFTVEFGKNDPLPQDGRLDAAAFHRNHAAIAPVLGVFLRDRTGDVLEIGSGTGQHAVAFASKLPAIAWWPTDLDDNHLRSIEAWRAHARLANLRAPVRLDASEADWRLPALGLPSAFVAMFCANVIHISSWRSRKGCSPAQAVISPPSVRCSSMAPSSAMAGTTQRATPRSTKACEHGIRLGVCAIRRI